MRSEALYELWTEAGRERRPLRIGGRAVVRFSDGTFAAGVLIPREGSKQQPGDPAPRDAAPSGIWVRLDDGRLWVALSRSRGHIRGLGPEEGER